MQKTKAELRARAKLAALVREFEKQKLDWHSIAHLSRDLSAVAQPQAIRK